MENSTSIISPICNSLVSILILNWNHKFESVRAIKSALSQSYPYIEIIVVDNGSIDGSVDYLQSMFRDITIISLDKNYGCPGGRNRGIPFI